MPLTQDLIQAQADLNGLSEAQIQAIIQLTTNYENTAIGQRIGEIYGNLDNDIKDTFGVEKQQGEKTYDYLKRVGKTLTGKVAELKELPSKLKQLETEKTNLEEQIKKGNGNEELAKKLKDAETKVEQLQKLYDTEKQTWEGKLADFSKQVQQARIESEFEKSLAGLTFKPELGELKDFIVNSAKDKILKQYTPDEIDNGQGGKVLVFRDANGVIINNPNNKLNPFSAGELLLKEIAPAIAQSKEGTGTKPPGSKGDPDTVDLSSAKSQVEADEIIMKSLAAKGLVRGSNEFAEEHKKVRTEHGVEKLPIR